jgi:hypothetical protein
MSCEGTSFKEEKKDYLIGLDIYLCPVREQRSGKEKGLVNRVEV